MATQWVITLATRTADEGRAAEELRGLLKAALRRFGLRCVSVSVSVSGDGYREVARRGGVEGREEEQRLADR